MESSMIGIILTIPTGLFFFTQSFKQFAVNQHEQIKHS